MLNTLERKMQLNKVYKVYTGKANKCMCGCAGKYSYTAEGAVKHNPGYDPLVNERSVKIIAGKLSRLPQEQLNVEDDVVWAVQGDRMLAAYIEQ